MKQTPKSTFSTMGLIGRAISWKKVNPSTHTSINQFNCIALTLYNMKIAKDPILDLSKNSFVQQHSVVNSESIPKCMNEKYKLLYNGTRTHSFPTMDPIHGFYIGSLFVSSWRIRIWKLQNSTKRRDTSLLSFLIKCKQSQTTHNKIFKYIKISKSKYPNKISTITSINV